jgi:SpoVK/Ycf46/Vps4 family AAA+-type ATPase
MENITMSRAELKALMKEAVKEAMKETIKETNGATLKDFISEEKFQALLHETSEKYKQVWKTLA